MYHLNLGSEMSPVRSVVLPCARDMPNEGGVAVPCSCHLCRCYRRIKHFSINYSSLIYAQYEKDNLSL